MKKHFNIVKIFRDTSGVDMQNAKVAVTVVATITNNKIGQKFLRGKVATIIAFVLASK